MELKKYVLLSDDTIVDVSKENYYLTQTGLIRYRENAVMQKTLMGTVKSTSDNILDLVEVGDLVEINEMIGIYYVNSIITEADGLRVFTCDQKYGYRFVFNETEVKSIYKRQPNGDYKKYEEVSKNDKRTI